MVCIKKLFIFNMVPSSKTCEEPVCPLVRRRLNRSWNFPLMDAHAHAHRHTDEHEYTSAHTLYTQTGADEELLIFNISEWENK